jgi:hypothetical protein
VVGGNPGQLRTVGLALRSGETVEEGEGCVEGLQGMGCWLLLLLLLPAILPCIPQPVHGNDLS